MAFVLVDFAKYAVFVILWERFTMSPYGVQR